MYSSVMVPEILADYLTICPGSRFVQLRGDSVQIHQYLSQGKASIGFVGTAADPKNYHYHPIAEDRLVLITANREPYRSFYDQSISGLHLLQEPFLLREESSGTRQEAESFLRRSGIDPSTLHVVAQIDNPEAIRSSVIRGLGVSVMSALAAGEDIRSGRLLAFELGNNGASRKIYLTWRKDALLTTAEQSFLNFVRSRPVVE